MIKPCSYMAAVSPRFISCCEEFRRFQHHEITNEVLVTPFRTDDRVISSHDGDVPDGSKLLYTRSAPI
jgi:hypothetical protein